MLEKIKRQSTGMSPYGQYCPLAKALDIVGDRWSLLIVRELLVQPCRFRDLVRGLPGIATNLLTERLRSLQEAGVLSRDDDGRYALTEWGHRLEEPLYGLARWAVPLIEEMKDHEQFRSHWFVHPVANIYGERDLRRPRLSVELRTDDSPVTIESVEGSVRVVQGPSAAPDIVLSGPPDAILGLLTGRLSEPTAKARGLHIAGNADNLTQLRPRKPVMTAGEDAALRGDSAPRDPARA